MHQDTYIYMYIYIYTYTQTHKVFFQYSTQSSESSREKSRPLPRTERPAAALTSSNSIRGSFEVAPACTLAQPSRLPSISASAALRTAWNAWRFAVLPRVPAPRRPSTPSAASSRPVVYMRILHMRVFDAHVHCGGVTASMVR
jgi:hypothetical protein